MAGVSRVALSKFPRWWTVPKRDINPPVSRTCVSACTRIDALTYARIQNARWNAATLVPFRRIGLNGHDVAPSRIQPTSKHALKYLFSTGCRPSPQLESSRVEGPFQGNFRLSNRWRGFIMYYYLFSRYFFPRSIPFAYMKFLKLLLIQYLRFFFVFYTLQMAP